MGMPLLFDISGGELMVIMLFALLFFGSKGIPDLARTLGRTMRQVRDASNEVQREIQRGANEVTRTVSEQRRTFQQTLEAEQAKTPAIPPPPGAVDEEPVKPDEPAQ
jgi:sec-independent protein translocase protein TatA